jgi:hypothetical protein
MGLKFTRRSFESVIVRKGAQQLIVAASRLVRPGKDRVDNMQRGLAADPLCRQGFTCLNVAGPFGML